MSMIKRELPKPAECFDGLSAAMRDDPEYAWGWLCNLAMPIMDAIDGCTHEQANQAGANLLQHLFGYDITTHPHFEYGKSDAQSYAEFRIAMDEQEDAEIAARGGMSTPRVPSSDPRGDPIATAALAADRADAGHVQNGKTSSPRSEPPPMTSPLESIARWVEAAEGAERGLDLAIFRAIHPEYDGFVEGRGGLVHPADGSDQRVLSDVRWSAYTGSLDAAETLIPSTADAAGERYRLEAWNSSGVHAPHVRASAWVAGAPRVYAATPALALCAAALRARAAGGGEG